MKIGYSISIEEVLPGRGEYIDNDTFFQTYNSVWYVWRDVNPVAIVDNLFLFTNSKFKFTFGTVGSLGMYMLVKRTHSARLEADFHHHHLFVPAENFSGDTFTEVSPRNFLCKTKVVTGSFHGMGIWDSQLIR